MLKGRESFISDRLLVLADICYPILAIRMSGRILYQCNTVLLACANKGEITLALNQPVSWGEGGTYIL